MENKAVTMSLERIIAQLVETAEETAAPATRAQRRALARRLRTLLETDALPVNADRASIDRGAAADAARLAAYLEGALSDAERHAFEAELAGSPGRRDELMAALAWIDAVEAGAQTPPAELTALALALEPPAVTPAKAGAGWTAWLERLLPRPRTAMAALASFAIVAVGVDIALHTSPTFRQAIEHPASDLPSPPAGDINSTRLPAPTPPDRAFLPVLPGNGSPLLLTAETINALLGYRDDPGAARRQALLAALVRAGGQLPEADRVRSIRVQPELYERLRQRDGQLPTRIAAKFGIDGELVIAIAN